MQSISVILYKYGTLAMFFCILLEYACFPVSSEIVLPLSGAIANLNGTRFFTILPLSILAGLLGTSVCYAIGRLGGPRLMSALGRRFPKWCKPLDASTEWFRRYGNLSVCLGRVIPIYRTYIAFIAGASKQPYLSFLSFSSIGIALWNLLLIGLGYLLRDHWNLVQQYYKRYEWLLLSIAVVIFFIIIYRICHRSKHNSHNRKKNQNDT